MSLTWAVMRFLRLAAAVISAGLLPGCSDPLANTDDQDRRGPRISRVTIGGAPRAMVLGGELRLVAAAFSESCDIDFCRENQVRASFTWKTSNPQVLTVNGGAVRAVGVGSARITAAVGDVQASVAIRVGAARVPIVVADGGTCGLAPDGDLYCWGLLGRPGSGLEEWSPFEPVPMNVPAPVSRASAGGRFGCGLTTDKATWCWTDKMFPVRVQGDQQFVQVSAGEGGQACAIDDAGEAWCWSVGETPTSMRPVPVPGGMTFTDVSAGEKHTCARTQDRRVYCWGENVWGQAGVESGGQSLIEPQLVEGIPPVQVLVAGSEHTCALAEDGSPWCWGRNNNAQLGRSGSDELPHPAPLTVSGAPHLVTLDGAAMTCGLTSAGEAYCWGQRSTSTGASVVPAGVSFRNLGVGLVVTTVDSWWGVAYDRNLIDGVRHGRPGTGLVLGSRPHVRQIAGAHRMKNRFITEYRDGAGASGLPW